MNTKEEANKEVVIQKSSRARRRFLTGVAVLSAFAFVAAAFRIPGAGKKPITACGPARKTRMVKMLAEDGTLVEIDASLIQSSGRKVSTTELQRWIKR